MVKDFALSVALTLISSGSASWLKSGSLSGGFLKRSTSTTSFAEGSFFNLLTNSSSLCPTKTDGVTNFLFTDNSDLPHCVEIDTFYDKDDSTASAKKSLFYKQGTYSFSDEALKLEDARVIVHNGCTIKLSYCKTMDNNQCDGAGELSQDKPGVYWLRAPPTDRADILQVDSSREVVARYVTSITVATSSSSTKCVTFDTQDLPSDTITSFDLDYTTSAAVDFDKWTGDLGYAFGAIGIHSVTVRPGCVAELTLTSPDQTDDDGDESWRVFLSPGSYSSLRGYLAAAYPSKISAESVLGSAVTVKGAAVHALVSVQVPGMVDIATTPTASPMCLSHHTGSNSDQIGIKSCDTAQAKTSWVWSPHKGSLRPLYGNETLDQCLQLADSDGNALGSVGDSCPAAASCGTLGCTVILGDCANHLSRKLSKTTGIPTIADISLGQVWSVPQLKCLEEGTSEIGSFVLAMAASVSDSTVSSSSTQQMLCLTAGADKTDATQYEMYPTVDDSLRVKACAAPTGNALSGSSQCQINKRQILRVARGYTPAKYAASSASPSTVSNSTTTV